MKRLFSFISLTLMFSVANATVHTVTAQNTPVHFLPVTVYAQVGDTILWIWIAGNHNVGPISASDIPAGASMWSAPIDAGNHSYEYILTVAGNYYYVCHPSTPHGEDAYIEVSSSVGVQQYKTHTNISFIYPNPVEDILHINSNTQSEYLINFFDASGKLIETQWISGDEHSMDVSHFKAGIYFLQAGVGVKQRTIRMVKQ